jgi:hypothetical protein
MFTFSEEADLTFEHSELEMHCYRKNTHMCNHTFQTRVESSKNIIFNEMHQG